MHANPKVARKPLSIESLGRAVKAEQVIYVQITGFNVLETSFVPKPKAVARVKVIDVINGTRTFPNPSISPDGASVEAELAQVSPQAYQSPSGKRAIEQSLVLELAEHVAKLFYTHERIELGERLGIR